MPEYVINMVSGNTRKRFMSGFDSLEYATIMASFYDWEITDTGGNKWKLEIECVCRCVEAYM